MKKNKYKIPKEEPRGEPVQVTPKYTKDMLDIISVVDANICEAIENIKSELKWKDFLNLVYNSIEKNYEYSYPFKFYFILKDGDLHIGTLKALLMDFFSEDESIDALESLATYIPKAVIKYITKKENYNGEHEGYFANLAPEVVSCRANKKLLTLFSKNIPITWCHMMDILQSSYFRGARPSSRSQNIEEDECCLCPQAKERILGSYIADRLYFIMKYWINFEENQENIETLSKYFPTAVRIYTREQKNKASVD